MAKINPVNVAEANTQQKALFDEIHGAFGAVPNMFKTIGHSAPALESMWTSFGALERAS